MPSEYAKAYENIRPSVVRVVSYVKKSRLREEEATGQARPRAPSPSRWARRERRRRDGSDDDVETASAPAW